jgi:hypothetical protein
MPGKYFCIATKVWNADFLHDLIISKGKQMLELWFITLHIMCKNYKPFTAKWQEIVN